MSDQIDVNYIADVLNNKMDLPVGVGQDQIDYVVAYQKPTAGNNYTWYRLYKSGWVEQGGTIPRSTTGADYNASVNLPITMANATYQVVTQILDETYTGSAITWGLYTVKNKTISSFQAYVGVNWGRDWMLKGMSAQS